MKRIIGMILLVFGFLISNIGVYSVTLYVAKGHIFRDNFIHDNNYRNEIGRDIFIGTIFFAVGLVLFIVGLLLIIAKTKQHKALELELKKIN